MRWRPSGPRLLLALAALLGRTASATGAESAAPAEDADRPYVEILQSTGAIDGPAEGGVAVPHWERVRLELRVKNRLSVEISDLEVEVALVSSSGTGEQAAVIPGWSFKETFSESPVPANDETYVRIMRELPARRTSPPADEIAYRAHIKSYRLSPPDVETAIRLLGSSHESDQLAALKSYELDDASDAPDGRDERDERTAALGRTLARAIGELPEEPSPSDALRMLFAVRAIGTLRDAGEVKTLLELPGLRDGRTWAKAVVDLGTRMLGASEAEDPRLRVLPSWAKDPSLFTVRAQDTLEDAVQDAILRMGDAAVPSLLNEAHLGSVPGVRARAERLLHALGRSTVRSQLSLRDREARLDVIMVLGAIGSPEPVPALIETLRGRDAELREAAMKAIERIGPGAVDPLVAAMGTGSDEPILAAISQLGARADEALTRAAARYGVVREHDEARDALAKRLELRLSEAQRARLVQELDRALELGREGSFTDAIQRLDAVFAQDPDLYMSHAKPIAETYLARGKLLFQRGDYDAAVGTLRTGLSIQRLDEAEKLLVDAQVALVRGYLDLGDLDRAEEILADADPTYASAETRPLGARLLALKASRALGSGDYGKARTLIDRARALKLDDADLSLIDRRLVLAENTAIVIVLGLLVPAIGLAIVVFVKRRTEAAKMRRIASAIDTGAPPANS